METRYFGESGDAYPKAVSGTYPQSGETHPLEKYAGRLARSGWGEVSEVVGYSRRSDGSYALIVDFSGRGGWTSLEPNDVIFKECESYWYAGVNNLID